MRLNAQALAFAAIDAEGIRFLRVRPEPPRPEVLTLREVRIGDE